MERGGKGEDRRVENYKVMIFGCWDPEVESLAGKKGKGRNAQGECRLSRRLLAGCSRPTADWALKGRGGERGGKKNYPLRVQARGWLFSPLRACGHRRRTAC